MSWNVINKISTAWSEARTKATDPAMVCLMRPSTYDALVTEHERHRSLCQFAPWLTPDRPEPCVCGCKILLCKDIGSDFAFAEILTEGNL